MSSHSPSPQVVAARRPPNRALGQNFLSDSRVARRIVSTAEIGAEDNVLEIGPGRGALTRRLAGTCGRLVAVELDAALVEELRVRFPEGSGVEILHDDAREISIEEIFDAGAPYKMVANLPYYAASPIARRFLTARRKPTMMVFMVQREVARAMAAGPGGMSLLSVMIQLYGSVRVAFTVPPRAFRPAPKVTSAVVRIDVYERPALNLDSHENFFDLVIAGFSAPRKQLRNSLKNGLRSSGEVASAILNAASIDPRRRPGTLSLEEWGRVYHEWVRIAPDPC